jgi:hypothetical protein
MVKRYGADALLEASARADDALEDGEPRSRGDPARNDVSSIEQRVALRLPTVPPNETPPMAVSGD